MDQAPPRSVPPHAGPHRISQQILSPYPRIGLTEAQFRTNRNGEMPLAVPEVGKRQPRQHKDRIAELRVRIEKLAYGGRFASTSEPEKLAPKYVWTLGAHGIDRRFAGRGLRTDAVHEIKPEYPTDGIAMAGQTAAAIGFGLRLAQRRLVSLQDLQDKRPGSRATMLWCWPRAMAQELGGLYGPGLKSLGIDPASLLIVEPGRQSDVLWVLEEALKSDAVALVAGALDDVALTPARRLALAAQGASCPCLLITHHRSTNTGAVASRWRISAQTSQMHAYDHRAPGARRYGVQLIYARGHLADSAPQETLEWDHETHRFRVAAGLADRTPEAGRTKIRAVR